MSLPARSALLAAALAVLPAGGAAAREIPGFTAVSASPDWAATVAMLVEWAHRFDVETCEIVQEVRLRRYPRSTAVCCGPTSKGCSVTMGPGALADTLAGTFGIRTSRMARALSMDEVRRNVDAGRPMVAVLGGAGAGRPVLVTGYEGPDQLVLLDPASGRRVVAHGVFRKSVAGIWTETYAVLTRPSAGVSCSRTSEPAAGGERVRLRCHGSSHLPGQPAVSPALAEMCRRRCAERDGRCTARCPHDSRPDECRARCARRADGCMATCP